MSFNLNSDAALRVAQVRNLEDRRRAEAWRLSRSARMGRQSDVVAPSTAAAPPEHRPRRLSWGALRTAVRSLHPAG